MLFLVLGCGRNFTINTCPDPVEYSREFQENLLRDLDGINSYHINQMLIDFYNINQQLRILNE
jgi:hypothetical protein